MAKKLNIENPDFDLIGIKFRKTPGAFRGNYSLDGEFEVCRMLGDWAFNVCKNGNMVGSLNKEEFLDDLMKGNWEITYPLDVMDIGYAFDKLYESIPIKHIIKEAIGVHEDVKTLSEFIHSFFSQKEKKKPQSLADAMFKTGMDAEEYIKHREEIRAENEVHKRGTYIFHKEGVVNTKTGEFDRNWGLPSLKDMKIHELKVKYNPKSWMAGKGTNAFFDIGSSEMTDKGLVLSVTFVADPKLSTIYHELTHALQYSKLGREKHIKGLMPHKTTSMAKSMVRKEVRNETEHNVLTHFAYYVYQSSEHEITAKVAETYGQLKGENLAYKMNQDMVYNEKKYKVFNFYLEGTNGYEHAKNMMEYDVFKEFGKVDPETTILFFSLIKDSENTLDLSEVGFKKFLRIIKLIGKSFKFGFGFKPKMISEDEVIRMMKNYNNHINKQGEKLYRKLIKLYGHFA